MAKRDTYAIVIPFGSPETAERARRRIHAKFGYAMHVRKISANGSTLGRPLHFIDIPTEKDANDVPPR